MARGKQQPKLERNPYIPYDTDGGRTNFDIVTFADIV